MTATIKELNILSHISYLSSTPNWQNTHSDNPGNIQPALKLIRSIASRQATWTLGQGTESRVVGNPAILKEVSGPQAIV